MWFQRRGSPPAASRGPFWVLPLLVGCASPGAPRPPSLQLPLPVRDLAASREGSQVDLSFTTPTHTTDGVLLTEGPLQVALCRQLAVREACKPVGLPAGASQLALSAHTSPQVIHLTDVLPAALDSGPLREASYRLEVRNANGRSAGLSAPAYVAIGAAPPPVTALEATAGRLGVRLRWEPIADAGEVFLRRRQLSTGTPPPPSPTPHPGSAPQRLPQGKSSATIKRTEAPGTEWLQADPGNRSAGSTTDGTVEDGETYAYTAVRTTTVRLDGHLLEVRSEPSSTAQITWKDTFALPTPTDLRAAAFASEGAANAYAVDLIWEPVQDLRLTGYLVFRTPLSGDGSPAGAPERLTPEPVVVPSFHDAGAHLGTGYRYAVRAVDAKGNQSEAATVDVAAPSS